MMRRYGSAPTWRGGGGGGGGGNLLLKIKGGESDCMNLLPAVPFKDQLLVTGEGVACSAGKDRVVRFAASERKGSNDTSSLAGWPLLLINTSVGLIYIYI